MQQKKPSINYVNGIFYNTNDLYTLITQEF